MVGAIARLMMMALFIGGIFFILYQIFAFFMGIQPGRSALKRDLKTLRRMIGVWTDQLIPWDGGELELISMEKTKKTSRSGMNKIVTGVIQSIYYEPMLAYAYKTYSRSKTFGLMLVKSLEHEIIYQNSSKGIQVFIDSKHVGTMNEYGQLFGVQSNQLLASIEDGLELKPIRVNNREVAVLKKGAFSQKHAGRLFEYVDNMSELESQLMLSLSLYELLTTEVK